MDNQSPNDRNADSRNADKRYADDRNADNRVSALGKKFGDMDCSAPTALFSLHNRALS